MKTEGSIFSFSPARQPVFLGMPQTHLSNPSRSMVKRAKPPPSIFVISHLQVSSTMVLSSAVARRKKQIFGG